MKPDYKNWMPKGMIWSFAAGTAVALALTLIVGFCWLKILLLILTLVLAGMTLWTVLMYRAFSYDGKRQMSRQIIDGVADYVKLPAGGRCLDVGCGSGALAIAVAKRNPQGNLTGIDRWGAEYASFSKKLCEENAKAEGVAERTDFVHGNALKLDFQDGTFDLVFLDWILLQKTRFFQHYYPETEGCKGYHSYGFNRKSQITKVILFPFISALLAWLCTFLPNFVAA